MAYAALAGVAVSAFLQEAAITGGLPELYPAPLAAVFLGGVLLLVVFGWWVASAWALGASLVPSLGALAYLAASGQALSPDPLELVPFYLAIIGIGVLLGRLLPRQQGGSRVGGLR